MQHVNPVIESVTCPPINHRECRLFSRLEKQRIVGLVLLVLISGAFNVAAAANVWDYIVGFSIREVSLDVYEKGSTDPEGILTQGSSLIPEFGLESKVNYFSDSNWGYKFALNIAPFKASRQEVDLETVDLNTSADGYFLYAMPVLVYDLLKQKSDDHLLLGLGFGIGYLNAEGDIILTESDPQIRHDFEFSEFTGSGGLLLQYITENWSYSASLYGPEVSDRDYEYNLFDFRLTVRRAIPF
jgi:hypothetical protein